MVKGNRFLTRMGENWHILYLPSFCAIWNFTTDGTIAKRMHALTQLMNPLVNFDPVILEFCRRVCAGRATGWALPSISS